MRTLWPVVTMVLGALAAVTTLSVLGADATQLMALISAAVIPTVTILITSSRVESRVDGVESKVDDVHKQVNGRMSQLIDAKTVTQQGTTEEV